MLASEVSDEFVSAVEEEVGRGRLGWDMVDSKELIAAVIKHYRIGLLNGEVKDADPGPLCQGHES